MSAQHTRAPWAWDGLELWHIGNGYSDKDDPHLYTGILKDKRLNTSRLRGNAQLIAAAPDLLAACEAALALMEADIADDAVLGFGPDDELVEVVQQLRDAIIRAKGERDAVDG